MSKLSVKVENIEDIHRLVDDLKKVDQDRAVKSGLGKGAKVFSRIGRQNLSRRNDEHTGNLRGSFITKVSRKGLTAYSGFNRSAKVAEESGISQGNHAHLVDRGTKQRRTKAGHNRGIMPASYFWSDARREGADEASKAVWDGVVTMADRLKRKYY